MDTRIVNETRCIVITESETIWNFIATVFPSSKRFFGTLDPTQVKSFKTIVENLDSYQVVISETEKLSSELAFLLSEAREKGKEVWCLTKEKLWHNSTSMIENENLIYYHSLTELEVKLAERIKKYYEAKEKTDQSATGSHFITDGDLEEEDFNGDGSPDDIRDIEVITGADLNGDGKIG